MANMSARILSIEKDIIEYGAIGGFAQEDNNAKYNSEKMYYGPAWFSDKVQDIY